MLRIANGTKATSPDILMARRLEPLYYANPLPDNSTGSKNRPFFENKDESGRPNAMEQVAAKQTMQGGVLKNYAYAKKVLAQRARDTTNQDLQKEGLPPVPSETLQLDPTESMNMELSNLIQALQNAIQDQTLDTLTVNEIKNIPRLIVALSPTYTQDDVATLLDIIGEMQESLQDATAKSGPRDRLLAFLSEQLEPYLVALVKGTGVQETEVPLVEDGARKTIRRGTQGNVAPIDMPLEQKVVAIRALAKKYFGNVGLRLGALRSTRPEVAPAGPPEVQPGTGRRVAGMINIPRGKTRADAPELWTNLTAARDAVNAMEYENKRRIPLSNATSLASLANNLRTELAKLPGEEQTRILQENSLAQRRR